MPSRVVVGEENYNFVSWEDGSTSPIRNLNLTADIITTKNVLAIGAPLTVELILLWLGLG